MWHASGIEATIHTFTYVLRRRTYLHAWPRPLQLLHSICYSTVTTFPFLVTVVFWGTMNSGWPPGRFEQWINISVHGLNSVFAIAEIVLPATEPQPWSHLSVVLLVLSVYLGLAYLTRETQGFYVYEWMNPAHGWRGIVLHVVGYAAGMVALFVLARYMVVVRNVVAKRVWGEEREIGEDGKSDGRSDLEACEIVSVGQKEKTRVSVSVV